MEIIMDEAPAKITGYRELSPDEIHEINRIKDIAIEVGILCEQIEDLSIDKRWHAIGKTHLQQGFMALVRSISKPETF
jgi:hypothetical protein